MPATTPPPTSPTTSDFTRQVERSLHDQQQALAARVKWTNRASWPAYGLILGGVLGWLYPGPADLDALRAAFFLGVLWHLVASISRADALGRFTVLSRIRPVLSLIAAKADVEATEANLGGTYDADPGATLLNQEREEDRKAMSQAWAHIEGCHGDHEAAIDGVMDALAPRLWPEKQGAA